MNAPQRNLVSHLANPVADVPLGVFHLLVIGIDRYLHWPRLRTAVKGACDLLALLKRDYGFTGVSELLDEHATRAAIIGELARLVDTLEPDDSLLIYYAGHGHIDTRTRAGAWIPVDAKVEEGRREYDAAGTWLQNSFLKDYLKACRARHIFLVSDSCFAGDFLRSHREAPPVITDAYVRASFAKASRQVLTSGGLEPVSDGGLDDHSVFTGFFLRGLKENREPYLLPGQLHERVRGGVAANAPQQSLLGTLHDAGGEVGGEFVLFRTGHASLEQALAQRLAGASPGATPRTAERPRTGGGRRTHRPRGTAA